MSAADAPPHTVTLPLAGEAARHNARANGLEAGLCCFTGGVEALDPSGRFELVLANLLRSELEPILPALVPHLAAGGSLVTSGLLAEEAGPLAGLVAGLGLRVAGERRRLDESGVVWASLCFVHAT